MKRFFTLVLALVSVAASAAGFDRKTVSDLENALYAQRGNPDPALIERANAYALETTATSDHEKLRLLRLRKIARTQTAGADMSWSAHKKFVDDAIAEAKLSEELTAPAYLDALYIWWVRDWDKELYTLLKTLPGAEKWIDAGHVCDKQGLYLEAYDYYCSSEVFPERAVSVAITRLNDPVKAFAAAKLITSRNYGAATVQQVVNVATNHLVGNSDVPATEMKEFLQNVNRKYSAMLLKDKAAWEPIIAAVRTMLETY